VELPYAHSSEMSGVTLICGNVTSSFAVVIVCSNCLYLEVKYFPLHPHLLRT
jgi:hypothetical protein